MGETLLIHEPRLGAGVPARTVRPYPRRGDRILAGFARALEDAAAEVRVTGRLFEKDDPPAWLVERVAGWLGDLADRGVSVRVPPRLPRPLLFLAAGVRVDAGAPREPGPEFWRTGRYRLVGNGGAETRSVPLPETRQIRLDLTGQTAPAALARIGKALGKCRGEDFVRLRLVGASDEPEVLSFGPRELRHHLPGGVEGAVVNRVTPLRAAETPEDDEARRAALAAARRALPDPPAATGIYEFRDRGGRVLYVGKAVDIRRRVASHYTAEAREPSPRGPMLLAARDLTWRETDGELQALLAEAERIQEARPPYNRQMREPEGARYLRADRAAPLPRLAAVRTVREDGASYYGPFPKRWAVERSLKLLQVVYGLPVCSWSPGRPAPVACTERDLSLCAAPCVGRVGLDSCRRRLDDALRHLTGEDGPAPRFGSLNSPGAGRLSAEDLRIFRGFSRSARRFLRWLRDASGTIPLPGGRTLLVLGGLRAGVREGDVTAWAAREIEAFQRRPPRTWVTPSQADEVRILAHWLGRLSRSERSRSSA